MDGATPYPFPPQCGAGAAFAVVVSVESALSVRGVGDGSAADLSEQLLVACMHPDLGRPHHDWCERGAWGRTALAYLNASGERLTSEAAWRYSAWHHRACDPARRPTHTWPADAAPRLSDYRAGVGRGSRDGVLRVRGGLGPVV
jgi:hypothetical protein